ncbi:MAG: DUF3365 domain-containing protein [Oculatellaceae cyanobacterium Prado106]|nr:DUF3365 domain-containing protein [Oculatellaceae cyanobacterium Prado106]
MRSRDRLANQFTILLSIAFIGGMGLSGSVLSTALDHRAQAEVSYRSQVLMQMINSVSTYTNDRITPLLQSKLVDSDRFISETIPSFAARSVFAEFRKDPDYARFFYKDAMSNPTNPADQADSFEAQLIEKFQLEPAQQTLTGFRDFLGEQLFYSAQPIVIRQSSCLRCHSTALEAPASHVSHYGGDRGYGWKLNEVLGTQILYIPAQEVFNHARQAVLLSVFIFMGVFALVIGLLHRLLQRRVIQPLQPMAQLAEKLSTEALTYDEAQTLERQGLGSISRRQDELGQLGRAFQRMVHEVYQREQKLKQQLQSLRVQIDDRRRSQQVQEIESTEYFQKLQQDAKEMRRQS